MRSFLALITVSALTAGCGSTPPPAEPTPAPVEAPAPVAAPSCDPGGAELVRAETSAKEADAKPELALVVFANGAWQAAGGQAGCLSADDLSKLKAAAESSKFEPQADAKKCEATGSKKHLLKSGDKATSWLTPCAAPAPAEANQLLVMARGLTTKGN